ncbi:MAG: asparagine synthase (glutamine-hydrolyzing) [Proteobacteria bacterium]|nr:MAG: asparagine synthase (glutamine-hydrolyzing) [Pseudomonadota bacterium]
MCGIAGFHLPGDAGDREGVLAAMLSRLTRRGPDSSGTFRAGDAFLGHRRLSIVDLSPQGNQPMLNETGDVALVCNGELYDYHGLRDGLAARGHRFVSQSDSEVILHLYEEKGIDCVAELRGMFAFAILDARRGQIHLARDRFGVKPLYWTLADGRFAFASELRALLACPFVAREIDLSALSRYLCFYYVPAPLSMLRGVRALEPGHVLTFEAGRAETRAYWRATDFLDPAAPEAGFSRERFLDELDALLADSVRIHLNADVPVGAFLSGGVDSSGIVAYMSRVVPSARTFCLTHEDPLYDERVWAARVARHCGTEHEEVRVHAGQRFDVELLDFLVEVYGEPFASPSAIAVHSVIQAMKGRVKCVLSGDGADELFAGYDDYARIARIQQLQRALPPGLARRLRGASRLLRFPGGARVQRAIERAQWSLSDFVCAEKGYFSFAEQSSLLSEDVLARLDLEQESLYLRDKLALRDERPSFENLYRFMVLQQLTDYMLTKTDRASMGHSVEVRVPYVDHVLFEHLCRAPASAKFDPANPKPLLKRVLERHLPHDVLYRPKQGFAIPLESFLGDAFWPHLASLLHDGGAAELFDVASVERRVAALRGGKLDADRRLRAMYEIWIVAVLLHWKRHVLDAA